MKGDKVSLSILDQGGADQVTRRRILVCMVQRRLIVAGYRLRY